MNVASLELCKELYELSRWDETPFYWRSDFEFCRYPDEWKHSVIYAVHKNYTLGGWIKDDTEEARIYNPAYDLGYLMRKLPGFAHIGVAAMVSNGSRNYRAEANRWSDSKHLGHAVAMTPEDAACMLAIELFKQGILTKEHNHGE